MIEPVTPPARDLLPDLIRAFALFGIAMVNVLGFSQPMSEGYFGGALETDADRNADFMVNALFTAKSYPLFAMMFGAGLGYQMQAAEAAAANFSRRYFRRMAVFAALGILHAIFFWLGDILLTYALLGMAFFALRKVSVKTLWRLGTGLIALNVLALASLGLMMSAMQTYMPDAFAAQVSGEDFMTRGARDAFGSGSFFDAALYRAMMFPLILPGVIMQQGLAVFGFFCFGLAAVKSGLLSDPAHAFWRRARFIFLPIGLAGSALGAWMCSEAASLIEGQFLYGMTVIFAASAFSALGYAGWIAAWANGKPGAVRSFVARAGSATLSAYLLQSVLFSLIFCAYGLGQFEKHGAAVTIAIAAGVAVTSIVALGLWRMVFARGPMEMFVRRLTYERKA